MTPFWNSWITATCTILGVLGVALAAGGLEATDGPARLYFTLIASPGTLEFDPYLRISLAVLGAVCVGWSLTLLAAVKAADALTGDTAASVWRLITVSLITWFVIDSSLSVAIGFVGNAMVNTIFFVALLVPILRSGVLKTHGASPVHP